MGQDYLQVWFENDREYLVPIHGTVDGLQNALDVNEIFITLVGVQKEGNEAEGIVIKPICVYEDHNGSVFYLKKKNPKFQERAHAPKEVVLDTELNTWKSLFRAYITENRLDNLFSKMGVIQDKSQIGAYLKALIDDAREDFLKDYDNVPEDKMKQICNIGSLGATMLMKRL